MTATSNWKKLATLLALVASIAIGGLPGPAVAAGVTVDLNTADETKLVEVPGIGPATAKRIVAWRKANGPFRRVEDLMKVKGIGERSLEKLRPYVTVSKPKSR